MEKSCRETIKGGCDVSSKRDKRQGFNLRTSLEEVGADDAQGWSGGHEGQSKCTTHLLHVIVSPYQWVPRYKICLSLFPIGKLYLLSTIEQDGQPKGDGINVISVA